MKPKTITILIILLIISMSYAQPGWVLQNSSINSFLYDVCFVDQNTGWVCGHLGTILYTSDGGNNWNDLNPPPSNQYDGIYFVDQTEGWVLGYNGIIRHTTDGGVSWNIQNTPTQLHKSDLYFVDANTGWTVGGKARTFTDPIREILHTIDGGNNWTVQYTVNNEDPLGAVHFLNENYGWAVGSMSTIMKTTDGGNNWITQMSGNGYQFEDVYFVNPDTGWVVGVDLSLQHYAVIFNTVDGGTTWNFQTFGMDVSFQGVQFVTENTGWVIGGTNTEAIVLRTTDGGANWVFQNPGTTNFLSALCFADENNGWAVGFDGTIIHTTNGGLVGIGQGRNATDIIPEKNVLYDNYPNPFNPTTSIPYDLSKPTRVILKIYNNLGQEIKTLVNEAQPAGSYQVVWDGTNDNNVPASSGIYIYRLQTDHQVYSRKMILLR